MKLLPITVVSLVVGAALGAALAYVEVGEVETRLAPPPVGGGQAALAPEKGPLAAPSVAVDEPTYDFGTIERGASDSHEFVFTNSGTADLYLEVGRTSCKCTLGDVEDRGIAPGESTAVRLEWTAKTGNGPFRQTATVLTNDPRQPTVELTVEGIVTDLTGLEPKEFILGRVRADEERTATVYLASYEALPDGAPLEVSARMSPGTRGAESFRVEVTPVPAEESPVDRAVETVRIDLSTSAGLPLGSLTEWVTIDTNLPTKREGVPTRTGLSLQVPVLAVVEGDITVHGAGWNKELGLLNLGTVAGPKGKSARLRLSFKGEDAAACRATVTEVDPAWLQVELGEPEVVREGVLHQPLLIRVPAGRGSEVRSGVGEEGGGQGPGDAVVRLKTGHPTTPELDVKVRFVIAGG